MLNAFAVCCAVGTLTAVAMGDSFAIARDGKSVTQIVLADEPALAARFAASELQLHIRKITGATVPIVSESAAGGGSAILVGESARTRALGLRSADFESQEYAIRFEGGDLVLIGRDEPPGKGADAGLPGRTEGKFGRAAEFNGRDQAIVVPNVPFSDAAGSLECWAYLPAEAQPGESTILRLDGLAPWTYHIIRRWPNSSSIGYSTYDGTTVRNVSSGELTEGWHHILATYDAAAGKAELFVDAASQGTTEYVRTTCAGTPLNIGGIGTGQMGLAQVGNPFAGRIDEVRVSSVVRPPALDAAPTVDEPTEVLLHLDEAKGPAVDSGGKTHPPTPMPGWYDERGTLNAVYDFLERSCGVRWYMPTDIGTVCPEKRTLVVDGDDIRRRPEMVYRWITPTTLYLPTKADPVPAAEADLWRMRMRLGGQPFWVCHSFGGYPDRFYKDHPDWFAQGYEGTPTQMCYTNEGLIAQVAQDARDFFDGKGNRPGDGSLGDVFGIVPMDDNRFCKCPRCQAELDADEADNPQFSNGKCSNYVWGFVNKVARAVRKTHPDKWIGALAYWEYAYYPEGNVGAQFIAPSPLRDGRDESRDYGPGAVELEPNVVVQMCLHTRNWWCPSMERNDRKVFDTWVSHSEGPHRGDRDPSEGPHRGDQTQSGGTLSGPPSPDTSPPDSPRPLYLWLYYCFPALQSYGEGWNGFPSYFAHTAIRQMAMYHKAGVRGIFIEHSSEFGQTHLIDVPDLYITLRLADDPKLGGEELFDEFFTSFYGAVAKPMREAYELIEDTYSTPANYPDEVQQSPGHQHQTEELAWKWLGTPERLARLTELVDAATARADTDLAKRRVALFRTGILDYMSEGSRQYREKAGGR